MHMPDELVDQVAASADSTGRPVHVLVVAYGDPDALARCLGGLDHRYPITVVDNSSSAHTRAVAAEAGAGYLDPGENLGFAAAVNLGLAELDLSRFDVLLLNPDAVIEPGAVELLERELAPCSRAVLCRSGPTPAGLSNRLARVLAVPHPARGMAPGARVVALRPALGLRDRVGPVGRAARPSSRWAASTKDSSSTPRRPTGSGVPRLRLADRLQPRGRSPP